MIAGYTLEELWDMAIPAPVHTAETYIKYGCHCPECVDAYNESRGLTNIVHGNPGYERGCRCDVCMEAMREAGRKRYKAKKQANLEK
jgi:hypothetical protein